MSRRTKFAKVGQVEDLAKRLEYAIALIEASSTSFKNLDDQMRLVLSRVSCAHNLMHAWAADQISGYRTSHPFANIFGGNDLKNDGGNTGKKPGNGADRGASASDDPMLGILEKLMRGPNGKGGVFTAIGEDGSVFQGETLAEVLNKIEETLTKQGDEDSDPLGGTPFNYETSGGM